MRHPRPDTHGDGWSIPEDYNWSACEVCGLALAVDEPGRHWTCADVCECNRPVIKGINCHCKQSKQLEREQQREAEQMQFYYQKEMT